MTAAAPHDIIRVRGARQNNLRGIDVDIPKRRITVFTGVSGSGKSSLVFGTIAAESQRLINETYSAFVQQFMASPARPDVESLDGLSATIVVDQERMGSNARSTVGTATDAYTMLRILFSRMGDPHAGTSGAFSFNVPEGMCPRCEGTGRVSSIDLDALVDRSKSLEAELSMRFRTSPWAAGTGKVSPGLVSIRRTCPSPSSRRSRWMRSFTGRRHEWPSPA